MKKRSLKNLTLNKQNISQLDYKKGGRLEPSDDCTKSGCSCVSCRPDSCDPILATRNEL
ncbi:hypothetical protein [Kordia jejudonensis]|uniref:hypothetical protein n=1 Tax=Kordia jejudonensis TaxID=1348245 RepID=UPI0012E01D41|nr:hypothetical protein [Kordia jejudonensis]